jgi:hypothetical protein
MMKTRSKLLILIPLLVVCRFAQAESPVLSLFNRSNFIDENKPYTTQGFWSKPSNTLYSKAVADWNDEDFTALEHALREAVFFLSMSDSPLRNAHIAKLQTAASLVPSFKQWAKQAKEEGDSASPAASGGEGEGAAASPVFSFLGKLTRHGMQYALLLVPAALVLVIAIGGSLFLRKRFSVAYCPKCKTTDKKMLTVRARSFHSLFRNGKRKCYCSACGYKWIQR